MPQYIHRHRVRYRESDPMGIVYHAHCIDWFEAARTEALRSTGVVYRELEENGLFMPVVDLHVRYLRPVRYDDLIEIVTTWSDDPPTTRLRFDYDVRHEGRSDTLIAGHVTLCFVDRASGRPIRAPEAIREAVCRRWTDA